MARSPSLSTIRDAVVLAIKTAMNPSTPSNVATVQSYRRFWRDQDKFNSFFKRTVTDVSGWRGLINGWMVKITSREVEAKELFRFYVKYRIEMHGYLGVKDVDASNPTPKTEKDFLDQIDDIKDQLRLNTTVFGNTEETSPVTQLENTDVVEIAGYACWYALLSLECEAIDTKFS